MIIGPILLAVALGLLGSAAHSPAAQWLDAVPHLGWIVQALGRLLPYAIVTVVFTFMYAFIPNTRVEVRAALIGGVTAGIIWALVGQVFTTFIVYSSQMMAVYTGFAIVLTTLIWVYLSWLILLIGAELAFYVQFPQYLPHGHESVDLGRQRARAARTVGHVSDRPRLPRGASRSGAPAVSPPNSTSRQPLDAGARRLGERGLDRRDARRSSSCRAAIRRASRSPPSSKRCAPRRAAGCRSPGAPWNRWPG